MAKHILVELKISDLMAEAFEAGGSVAANGFANMISNALFELAQKDRVIIWMFPENGPDPRVLTEDSPL